MTENQFETVVLSLGSRQYLENSISSIDNLFFPLRIGKIPVYSNERFDKIQQINVDSFNSLQRFSRLCHHGSKIPHLRFPSYCCEFFKNLFLSVKFCLKSVSCLEAANRHCQEPSSRQVFRQQALLLLLLLLLLLQQALSGDLFKAGPQTAAKSGNASLQSTLDN